MANYFVSTSGSDITGDGSLLLPWRTINYAKNQMGAGTISEWKYLYIAAGKYGTENVTSNYDYVEIIGDISGKYFNTIGEVVIDQRYFRIYNNSSSNSDIRSRARNITVKQPLTTTVNLYYVFYSYPGTELIGCIGYGGSEGVWGDGSRNGGIIKDCVFSCNYRIVIYNTEFYNCNFHLLLSYVYGNYTTSTYNCVFFGATDTTASRLDKAYNCVFTGFYKGITYANDVRNCVFINGLGYAFSGVAASHIKNCLWYCRGILKYYDENGASSDIDWQCNDNRLREILDHTIKAMAVFTNELGYTTEGLNYDVFGKPRLNYNETMSIGLERLESIDYSEKNSIISEGISVKRFDLPCKSGIETTLTCDIVSTGTTSRPQLVIYDQDGTLIDSDVATADNDSLSVSVTPANDHVYRVWLYATDSTAGASTTFSNIKLNGVVAVINDAGEIYPVLIGSDVTNEYNSYSLPLKSQVKANQHVKTEVTTPVTLNYRVINKNVKESSIVRQALDSHVKVNYEIESKIK